MKVTVRFFAGCREAAKRDHAGLTLADGASLGDLQDEIERQFPELAKYVRRVRYAVNHDYADADAELKDGDEVAMIPPVAGG